jgi:excisionase family DNA binding protein
VITVPHLIDIRELADVLGISRRKLESMIIGGQVPAPIRWGRVRRWHPEVIDRWLAEQAGLTPPKSPGSAGAQSKVAPGRPRSTY